MLYFDNIIISGSDENQVNVCKQALLKEFDIKDKSKLKYFLGLEIDYERKLGIMKICQKTYLKKILKRFNFQERKPCSTPIDPYLKLDINENENNEKLPIKELIGCLKYLMLGSRLDMFSSQFL